MRVYKLEKGENDSWIKKEEVSSCAMGFLYLIEHIPESYIWCNCLSYEQAAQLSDLIVVEIDNDLKEFVEKDIQYSQDGYNLYNPNKKIIQAESYIVVWKKK